MIRCIAGLTDRLVMALHAASLGRGFPLWVALMVGAVVLSAAEGLLAYRQADAAAERKARTLTFASELRALGDRELNSVLYLTSGLSAYFLVRHEDVAEQEVNAILEAVFRQGQNLRVLSLALGYRAAFIFPLQGNEAILGQDYRQIPAQWPQVKAAIERRSGVLTGPVNLVQGGKGLIFRMPIFVREDYWGLLSTVIDMAAFNAAAFRPVADGPYDFAVRSVEADPSAGGMLWGRREVFENPLAVKLESAVPGGIWEYAVVSLAGEEKRTHWWMRLLAIAVASMAGLATYTVLVQRRRLAQQAGFDALTDLPNRRLFDDRLEQCLRRSQRDEKGGVAVIFLDLNGFKQFNDRCGHRCGDGILQVVARRVREEVRLADTVSRWAGDEFALIIEEAQEDEVMFLVTRLRSVVAAPFRVSGVPVTVTAAFGVAFYPREASSPEGLLELADQRMFSDKQAMSDAGKLAG